MKALLRFRPSPALAVAFVALLVALTETSWADVTQRAPRNSIGTAQIRPGGVTASDIRTGAVTSNKIRNGAVGVRDLSRRAALRLRGPAGPPGPAGPAGATGPAGVVTRHWAVVSPSGALARSSGAVTSGRMGLGVYDVIFNANVQGCMYLATEGDAGNIGGNFGFVSVGRRPGNAAGVRVHTHAPNGSAADRGFHLIVVC